MQQQGSDRNCSAYVKSEVLKGVALTDNCHRSLPGNSSQHFLACVGRYGPLGVVHEALE